MNIKKIISALMLPAILLTMTSCFGDESVSDTKDTSSISDSVPLQTDADAAETDNAVSEKDTTETEAETTVFETDTTTTKSETTTASITTSAAETETSVPITEAVTAETENATVQTTLFLPEPEASSPKTELQPTETDGSPAVTTETSSAARTESTTASAAEITTTPSETSAAKPEMIGSSMRNITTMELVREMGLGINLGNTLESCGDWINKNGGVSAYETAWGSPIITEKMIKGYAECGFGVLRIPVAWSNLMGENYTINPDYMARVKQITDWTIGSGMYAIVNIHYDGGWWTGFPTDKEECMKKYTRIWEQITEEFKDYSDKLMFESLNEEGGWESLWSRWSGSDDGKTESFNLLNEINQKFVDIVRSSGGNNQKRHLLIAGYNTDIDLTCDSAFVMPKDKENRCAVSVHYYTPSNFCILEQDADWGKAQTEWGSEADIKQLTDYMDMLKTTFVDKGIPVIIGEYGVSTGNKTPEMIRLFLSSVAKEAYEREMCPVLWDITDVFYDRGQCGFKDSQLLEQIMAAKGKLSA